MRTHGTLRTRVAFLAFLARVALLARISLRPLCTLNTLLALGTRRTHGTLPARVALLARVAFLALQVNTAIPCPVRVPDTQDRTIPNMRRSGTLRTHGPLHTPVALLALRTLPARVTLGACRTGGPLPARVTLGACRTLRATLATQSLHKRGAVPDTRSLHAFLAPDIRQPATTIRIRRTFFLDVSHVAFSLRK